MTSKVRNSCLPDKLHGLVASGEDGLAGYEQGGLPMAGLPHHENHVEKLVEHPPQGLMTSHYIIKRSFQMYNIYPTLILT